MIQDAPIESGGVAPASALDRLRRMVAELESREPISPSDVAVLQAVRETLALYDREA